MTGSFKRMKKNLLRDYVTYRGRSPSSCPGFRLWRSTQGEPWVAAAHRVSSLCRDIAAAGIGHSSASAIDM